MEQLAEGAQLQLKFVTSSKQGRPVIRGREIQAKSCRCEFQLSRLSTIAMRLNDFGSWRISRFSRIFADSSDGAPHSTSSGPWTGTKTRRWTLSLNQH
jgi:hypothetical protein